MQFFRPVPFFLSHFTIIFRSAFFSIRPPFRLPPPLPLAPPLPNRYYKLLKIVLHRFKILQKRSPKSYFFGQFPHSLLPFSAIFRIVFVLTLPPSRLLFLKRNSKLYEDCSTSFENFAKKLKKKPFFRPTLSLSLALLYYFSKYNVCPYSSHLLPPQFLRVFYVVFR